MSGAASPELKLPPKVSGEKPDVGHMEEFSVNFARFLMRCNAAVSYTHLTLPTIYSV